MKKLFTLLTISALSLCAWSKPLLVGHRGSLWGLENSVESFTNGAKKGYQYLETDWKLTKDKQFVCSHDDDDTRLGGTKNLATSTLEELQSETLTQTRSGVIYTGRLCSAKEYLDVCREYNVKPVIELKWTTGINSNDQSNIPLLIKFIEEQGFRDKCIILTSMKPCLEYIRKNYPDIQLQFLTGQYWDNHYDWCVEWGMDVDIQVGYFDKATVEKFHQAGLKVNIWTCNDNSKYETYGNMGVDMITTDYLDPATLPALDPSASFIPNYIDYPKGPDMPARGFHTLDMVTTTPWPASIPAADVVKSVYANKAWYVAYNTDDQGLVAIVNPTSGVVTKTCKADGAITDLAVTTDGHVYYLTSTTLGYIPESAVSGKTVETFDLGSRLALAVSGRASSAIVYMVADNPALSTDQRSLIIANHTSGTPGQTVSLAFPAGVTAPAHASLTVSNTTRQHVLLSWDDKAIELYADLDENTLTADAPSVTANATGTRGFGRYATYPIGLALTDNNGSLAAVITDNNFGNAESHIISSPMTVEGSASAMGGAVATDGTNVYVMAHGTALNTFTHPAEQTVTPMDIQPTLERLWIFSNTTDNHPGNIDGTNAQQGTAVNGLFYINNCVEKLIHVFDQTGHIGTIPGGAGWGCCRDDAGNIIVRDDKLTGATHDFIIYPAGATVDDYGTPVKLTIEFKLSGQTNFINASGDVLGDGGYIYLYPNKQSAICMARLEHGEVVASFRSGDLKMTGSTAGYVVPLNNNAQNWLYQIRNTAIHEYVMTSSVDFSTSRSATSGASRNSTGGAAVMNLLGNKIVAINTGAHYKGGFSVKRDKADGGTVIATVDPIGKLGYETGGNYSTFNWLIPEKQDDGSYMIYQYCPANGIAAYRLYDTKTQGVNVLTPDVDSSAPTMLFNLQGVAVDPDHASPGIYIRRQGATVSKIIIR